MDLPLVKVRGIHSPNIYLDSDTWDQFQWWTAPSKCTIAWDFKETTPLKGPQLTEASGGPCDYAIKGEERNVVGPKGRQAGLLIHEKTATAW